ncbi:hypothetical protein [Maribellus sp. YY47]|uniref:hypothetical protein n=1 Tax=Maribellus sp. YY47 TaxID=2929486 RepID=UPI002000663F|nr:hypothetical protein [Maribellus sp. YY47]MCK3684973.1 hypothetical protein [Maribellus sp. YY47]
MKPIPFILMLTLVLLTMLSHGQDTAECKTNVFCELVPDGWECQIIKENFPEDDIPKHTPTPEAIVKYYHPNREFENMNSIGQERVNPALILNLYPISRKNELSKFIKSQQYLSHCIPVYFGETADYFIITSPCFKNKGVYTEEANSAIADLYKALDCAVVKRKYYLNEHLKFEKY